MKIIAFAASSSRQSINKMLVSYAASLLTDHEIEILDLNDYEMPLFSVDREQELGQPELAHQFLKKLGDCDAILLSFAEHNGSYSAAYKNLFDWCSRINGKVFQDKPMILLSTSPGARGGKTVLELALNSIPRFNGNVLASLSIPSFHDNFDLENQRLSNEDLNQQLINLLKQLK